MHNLYILYLNYNFSWTNMFIKLFKEHDIEKLLLVKVYNDV